jgi:intraflagellar transport protein 122
VEYLTHNAVTEKRFQDAAQYFWLLASEALRQVKEAAHPSRDDLKNLRKYEEYLKLGEIYHAYFYIHKLIEDPY